MNLSNIKLTKTMVLPLISSAFLAITFVTGHKFANGEVEFATDIVVAAGTFGLNIYGIIKSHGGNK